jgi:heme-degrading monooxygenase HmoA
MYARVSTFMGKPENISQAIKPLKEAFITKEKGWKGGYALVNRQTGKMLTMTLWETKEDMEATVQVANQIRGQAARLAGAAPPTVEVYEVALTPED